MIFGPKGFTYLGRNHRSFLILQLLFFFICFCWPWKKNLKCQSFVNITTWFHTWKNRFFLLDPIEPHQKSSPPDLLPTVAVQSCLLEISIWSALHKPLKMWPNASTPKKSSFWIAIQWLYWHMLLVFLAFVVSFFPWKVAFWCLLAQQTHLLEHIHFSLKYLNSPSKLEHQVSTKTSRNVKSQVTLHPSSGLPKKLMLHGATRRVAYLASWNCLTSWYSNQNNHKEISIFITTFTSQQFNHLQAIFVCNLSQSIGANYKNSPARP